MVSAKEKIKKKGKGRTFVRKNFFKVKKQAERNNTTADSASFYDEAFGGVYLHSSEDQESLKRFITSKGREKNLDSLYNAIIDSLQKDAKDIIALYKANEDVVLKEIQRVLQTRSEEDTLNALEKIFKLKEGQEDLVRIYEEIAEEVSKLRQGKKVSKALNLQQGEKTKARIVKNLLGEEDKFIIKKEKFAKALQQMVNYLDKQRDFIIQSLQEGSFANVDNVMNMTYAKAFAFLDNINAEINDDGTVIMTREMLSFLESGQIQKQLGILREAMLPSIAIASLSEDIWVKQGIKVTLHEMGFKKSDNRVYDLTNSEDVKDLNKDSAMFSAVGNDLVRKSLTTSDGKTFDRMAKGSPNAATGRGDIVLSFTREGKKKIHSAKVKLDVKINKNVYKDQKTAERQVQMGQILSFIPKGNNKEDIYVFVNALINNLIDTKNDIFAKMMFLIIMVKVLNNQENGVTEIFDSPDKASNFVIMGNKLVRFSDFLSQIFKLESTDYVYWDSQPFSLITDSQQDTALQKLFKIKSNFYTDELKEVPTPYSREAFNLLKQNSQYISEHKLVLEKLKANTIIKSKISVGFRLE